MLTNTIVAIAEMQTENMARTGLRLLAERSDIATLTGETFLQIEEVDSANFSGQLVHELSEQNAKGVNPHHDQYQEQVVEAMANRITAMVDFIKNKVIPTIGDVAQRLMEETQSVTPDVRDIVEIIPLEVSPLVPHLLERLGGSALGNVPDVPPVKMGLSFDRRYYYVSGIDDNRLVDEFLDGISPEDHLSYFSRVYNTINTRPALAAYVSNLSAYQRCEFALTIFLTIDGITNNPPDSLRGVDLGELANIRRAFRHYALELMVKSYKLITQYQVNTLVIRNQTPLRVKPTDKPNTGYQIRVEGRLYRQYLKSGGTKTALAGRCVADDGVNTYQGVLNNTISYVAAAQRSERLLLANQNAKLVNRVIATGTRIVKELMGTETTGDAPYAKAIPADAVELAKTYLKNLDAKTCADTHRISLMLVAGILFARSPAHEILNTMEGLGNSKEDDVDEVAFVAIAIYVAKFLASQLDCEKADFCLTKGL